MTPAQKAPPASHRRLTVAAAHDTVKRRVATSPSARLAALGQDGAVRQRSIVEEDVSLCLGPATTHLSRGLRRPNDSGTSGIAVKDQCNMSARVLERADLTGTFSISMLLVGSNNLILFPRISMRIILNVDPKEDSLCLHSDIEFSLPIFGH